MMDNRHYVLVDDQNRRFTYLHRYLSATHSFEGEHSMLHNRYSGDTYFLSKFLIASKDSSLRILTSSDLDYKTVTDTYARFLEEDIEKVVEEKMYREREARIDHDMDKDIGKLQISIVKMMIEKKLEDFKAHENDGNVDQRLILGKQVSLEWALSMIEDVLQKQK
jgi:hypothetical protein